LNLVVVAWQNQHQMIIQNALPPGDAAEPLMQSFIIVFYDNY
jgi:hypothetical protein